MEGINMNKSLVAYFSCSGVTAKAAQEVAATVGADLYEIKPKEAYTAQDLDWMDKKSRSTLEMNDIASRPDIATRVEHMDAYDVVFVGFPIWWYVEPRIIDTFLESYDFEGKTIVPFATSGGSGVGKTDESLKKHCDGNIVWKPTQMLNGRITGESLRKWIDSLNLA